MFNIDPHKKKEQKETGRGGVEDMFVKRVRLEGGKAYKFVSEMNRGVSDRLVVFPGQVWFVEIKRDHGKLTKLQKVFGEFIKSSGLNYYVVYGQKGIEHFINKAKAHDQDVYNNGRW